ncbi:unnamed protein product [Chondrus crispus]|uniref:Ubiquitin-conjugating enzyme E2 H n=1 Tax=Chondrus crispus TaxID=2769 RepID=R7QF75_CHOCR|nr:unnamed protein product [Chondrus crispus]CDF36418.1 unnamed protein product [Chondrus crispus]|eukprot:XP_005716237.1 unnamed protein product [Chondrus crispus]
MADGDRVGKFYVKFHGPKQTPYEGGVWKVHVELPENYPYKSPSIGFINRLYHPNVDEMSGSVCLDVINQTWSPMYDLTNIFEVFLPQLLTYPNPTDPLNGEAAALQMREPDRYKQKVREYVQRYAKPEDFPSGSADDKEDDDDASRFSMTDSEGEDDVPLPGDVGASNPAGAKDIEKLDIGPLGLILGLRSDAIPMARIKGLAADYLLAAAISELQHWQGSLNSQSEKAAQVHTLSLKAWKPTDPTDCDAGTTIGPNLVESREAVVYGRRPIALQLSRFLSSSLSEWLPFTVCRMLQNDSFTEALRVLLLCPNVEALWKKVPRYAVSLLLRQRDAVGLESLALRVNQSKKDLVDQVCADALGMAAMTDMDGFDVRPTGANALILESLGMPLGTTVRKRAGKIVQRIIMDIGGERDLQARRALFSVAQILPISRQGSSTEPNVVGALVSTHFMLVMDAVNRGLFSSKASE